MAWEYVVIDDGSEFEYAAVLPVNTPEDIEEALEWMACSIVPEVEIHSIPAEPPNNDSWHFVLSRNTGKRLTRDGVVGRQEP